MPNRLFSALLLALSFALLTDEANAGWALKLQNEGEVSLKEINTRCASGALVRPTVDCLVVVGARRLQVFELRGDSLHQILDEGLEYSNVMAGPSMRGFVVGDFDSSGRDEIILCLNNHLVRWEWGDNGFHAEHLEFPYHIVDCVAGPLFDDGRDVFVTTSLSEPLSVSAKLRVNVWRIDTTGVGMVYENIDEFDMNISEVFPPDRLVCIGDVHNAGRSQLVISRAQSDVSPTLFLSYFWNAQLLSFELNDKWYIVNNAIVESVPSGIDRVAMSFVSGPLVPLVLAGTTHLLAWEAGTVPNCSLIKTDNPTIERRPSTANHGANSATVVLNISEDIVSCWRFRNDDLASPWRGAYIEDSDGSGRGLVVVGHEYFERPWPDGVRVGWFRYYRLLGE